MCLLSVPCEWLSDLSLLGCSFVVGLYVLLSIRCDRLSDLNLLGCFYIVGWCVLVSIQCGRFIWSESARILFHCRLVCVNYLFRLSDCLIWVCSDVFSLPVCVCLVSIQCERFLIWVYTFDVFGPIPVRKSKVWASIISRISFPLLKGGWFLTELQ